MGATRNVQARVGSGAARCYTGVMSEKWPICLAIALMAACGGGDPKVPKRSVTTVFAGKREGAATYYWESGELAAKGQFHDDKPTGKWRYTWPGGGVQCCGIFVNGEQDGPWVFMSRNGQVLDEQSMTALEPGETDHMVASSVAECPMPSVLSGTGFYESRQRLLSPTGFHQGSQRTRSLDKTEVAALLDN